MTAENLPRRWRLLSYGDPCVDLVTAVAGLPERGGKVLGRPVGVLSGGTTSNFVCAAGRLGLASAVFRASMSRAVSPPLATRATGFNGSPGLAEMRNST